MDTVVKKLHIIIEEHELNKISAVAAEDVGLNQYDIIHVHNRCRYVTGVAEDMGGLGNPARIHGKGIICALEAALEFLKRGTLEGKKVAVQGVGNIGSVIIDELLDCGVASVYATDCNQKHVDDLRDLLAKKANGRLEVKKVPFGDQSILGQHCSVLIPCATGKLFTKEKISEIQDTIICGPAHDQLGDSITENDLTDRHIVFLGDYVTNRMGLVNQVVEPIGRLPNDPLINRHFNKTWEHSIFAMTMKLLKTSADNKVSLSSAAKLMANELIERSHPSDSFRRSELIIRSLIETGWFKNLDFWRRRSNFPGARNPW